MTATRYTETPSEHYRILLVRCKVFCSHLFQSCVLLRRVAAQTTQHAARSNTAPNQCRMRCKRSLFSTSPTTNPTTNPTTSPAINLRTNPTTNSRACVSGFWHASLTKEQMKSLVRCQSFRPTSSATFRTKKHSAFLSLINYSNTTKNYILFYRRFGFTSEAFIRTDFRCRSSACKSLSHTWLNW